MVSKLSPKHLRALKEQIIFWLKLEEILLHQAQQQCLGADTGPQVPHSAAAVLTLTLHWGPFAKYSSLPPAGMHHPKKQAPGSITQQLLVSLRHNTRYWLTAAQPWVLSVLQLLLSWGEAGGSRAVAPSQPVLPTAGCREKLLSPSTRAARRQWLPLAARQCERCCLKYYLPATRPGW